MAAQLATSASKRLLQGFRPSTLKQYNCMWKDILTFHVVAGMPHYQVNTEIIEFLYSEFLHSDGLSANHITNYMAALRALHILHAFQIQPFKDDRIPLFLNSIKIQAPLNIPIRPHIGVDTLFSIVFLCHSLPHPQISKPLYFLCYFSFLRLSNVLPDTISSCDPTRQLSRGVFIEEGAVLLIKWSMTMQDRKQSVTIPLPNLGDSDLCPIKAIDRMIQLFPAPSNDPLFLIPGTSCLVPLTDSVARKHLRKFQMHCM